MQHVDICLQLRAHEGELTEGRTKDVPAKMRVGAEHQAEDGHEQQQQGK